MVPYNMCPERDSNHWYYYRTPTRPKPPRLDPEAIIGIYWFKGFVEILNVLFVFFDKIIWVNLARSSHMKRVKQLLAIMQIKANRGERERMREREKKS